MELIQCRDTIGHQMHASSLQLKPRPTQQGRLWSYSRYYCSKYPTITFITNGSDRRPLLQPEFCQLKTIGVNEQIIISPQKFGQGIRIWILEFESYSSGVQVWDSRPFRTDPETDKDEMYSSESLLTTIHCICAVRSHKVDYAFAWGQRYTLAS